MRRNRTRHCMVAVSIVGLSLAWSPGVFADDHVKGYITGREPDGTVMMRTDDSRDIRVVMNDSTKVMVEARWFEGKWLRKGKASSAELVPGLRVEVSGEYANNDRFDAQRVSFSKSNLKVARAVQAGITPTDQKLTETGQRLTATDQRLAATAGAVEATNTRISDLDNYGAVATVTVYFANGKTSIEPRYQAQLQHLVAQAKGVSAAILEVKGYASAVGSGPLNQRLSRDRADAVTDFLQQNGVAPTSIVVPAAMGVSQQVASNRTAQGQAENRRAVVTLLQNKGIANRQAPAN
jgi:outer membrane protein OmpA-like peptidoglycan-associated protein